MVRRIEIYIMLLLGLVVMSCSDSIEAPDDNLVAGQPGTLTIRFTNSLLTRSTVSDKSENLINNLVIGLYRDVPSDDIEPSKFIVLDDVNKYSSHEFILPLNEALVSELFNNTDGSKCRVFAVANIPNGTFNDSDRPTIAQLKSIPIDANFCMQDVQPSFVMAGSGSVTYTAPEAGEKIGSASGGASLLRAAAKIRLNVALPDTIHVGQTSPTDTDFEIWKPVPTFGIFSLINCGVQKAVSAPESILDTSGENDVLIPWKPTDKSAYYNSTLLDGSWRELTDSGTGEYSYVMDVPFYTFPNAWVESPEEDYKTTLTLTVAWRKEGELSWYTFFYQIPITPANMPQIVRNHSYTINLKVGMLGALTQEDPMEVDNLSYQVVDWGSENVDVDIQDFRYLVVDPNVITVNNEEEVTIPFYSSHPVDVENVTMTFQRFNYYSNGNGDVVNIEVAEDILNASTWIHQIEENGVTKTVTDTICTIHPVRDPKTNQWMLKIKHPMAIWNPYNSSNQEVALTGHDGSGEKTITAESLGITRFRRPENPEIPFSLYIFRFKLCHSDKNEYEQEIEIRQYPGMSISVDPNRATQNEGNIYVNGYYSGNHGLGTINGIDIEHSANANINMYVINVSQLSSTSDFYIGDPRSKFINNDLGGESDLVLTANSGVAGDWNESAQALYYVSDPVRKLMYYYPTNESQDPVSTNMIAPKFRIASSWGGGSLGAKQWATGNGGETREKARRRVATYQEQSRPAGRWRLPTLGEFKYITRLSAEGKIPTLFTTSPTSFGGYDWYYVYWTAQGPFMVSSDGDVTRFDENDTSKLYLFTVRAVYDEWYWEQYPQYSLDPAASYFNYTLGDVPRGVQ